MLSPRLPQRLMNIWFVHSCIQKTLFWQKHQWHVKKVQNEPSPEHFSTRSTSLPSIDCFSFTSKVNDDDDDGDEVLLRKISLDCEMLFNVLHSFSFSLVSDSCYAAAVASLSSIVSCISGSLGGPEAPQHLPQRGEHSGPQSWRSPPRPGLALWAAKSADLKWKRTQKERTQSRLKSHDQSCVSVQCKV